MRGPVEQLGCARRPVKAEVAGSNPVGTARTGTSCLLSPGQVAQSVERAAENRKVGGSIPSLPTTSGQVRACIASTPLGASAPGSAIVPPSTPIAATSGRRSPPGHSTDAGGTPTPLRTATARLTASRCAAGRRASRSQSDRDDLRPGRGRAFRVRAICPPSISRIRILDGRAMEGAVLLHCCQERSSHLLRPRLAHMDTIAGHNSYWTQQLDTEPFTRYFDTSTKR
jgi:hypothetical protein